VAPLAKVNGSVSGKLLGKGCEMEQEAMFEDDVAAKMGLSRDQLRDIRSKEMDKGRDWRVHKNRVVLLPSGIEAIKRRLPEAPCIDPETEPERAPRGAEAGESAKTGHVCRLFGINIQLMEVRLEENGAEVRVKVRNNRMFVIGQRVPVKRDGETWFLGCRHPVARGRLNW